jgi:ribosomal protein S18 acetylase RimI-like enzyme
MAESLSFRIAELIEAQEITALINAAFRSEPSGQTWLSDDQSQRTDMLSLEQVRETLNNSATPILLGTAPGSLKPAALCILRAPGICPKTTGVPTKSWLSVLAVDPHLHRRGYGATVLRRAESFIREKWDAERLELNVVNKRSELRAWYGKHGFQETGQIMEFPYSYHGAGKMVNGLELVVLGKNV